MTKIPSVEKAIEQIGIATYGGRSFEPTGMYREKLTKILNTQRTALLTELRESGLLKEKELEGELDINRKRQFRGYNTLARNIKAHLDELIKSNSI